MREIILEKLKEIEDKNNVIILFAIESGSRGWGFSSSDSDYDVRFVYKHNPDWYLTIEENRDVIEKFKQDSSNVSELSINFPSNIVHIKNQILPSNNHDGLFYALLQKI